MRRGLCPSARRRASRSSLFVLVFLVGIAAVSHAQDNGTFEEWNCHALSLAATKCYNGVQSWDAFRHTIFMGVAQCANGGWNTSVIEVCTPDFMASAVRAEAGQLFGMTSANDASQQGGQVRVRACMGNFSSDGATPETPEAPYSGAQPAETEQAAVTPPAPSPHVFMTSASQALGELAPADALLDLFELTQVDASLGWTDILPPLREKMLSRSSGMMPALPLDGAALLMVYRRDVLRAMNVQVPATWGELLAFVEGYGESRPAWAPGFALCAPAGTSCDGVVLFTAIWHSIAQGQGLRQGVYFSLDALQPLVDTPAFASAVHIFASLWRHALQQPGGQCRLVHPGLRLGNCSLTIASFEQVKDVALSASPPGSAASINGTVAASGAVLPGAFDVSALPGSTYVLDPNNTSNLVPCNPAVCPYGETLLRSPSAQDQDLYAAGMERFGPRPTQQAQAALVNRVPFVVGSVLVGSVSGRASVADQLLAWHTLTYIASPNISRRLMVTPGSNIAPFRTSHLWGAAGPMWVAAGYDAELIRSGLEALGAALMHPNLGWELHMAGEAFCRSALSDSLARLLSSLSLTPDEVAKELNGLQARLASHYSTSSRYVVQYKDFLNVASAPAPNPPPPSSPPSGGGASRKAAIKAIAVSISGSAVLLLAAYVTYRYAFAAKRSGGRKAWSSNAPAVSPTTTLLITDIEGSTKLWEELPETVMGCALRIHHTCIRRTLTRHRGYESATEGDSFVLAFHDPVSALAFAIEVQQELLEQVWPQELLQTEVCSPVYTSVPSGFPFKRPSATLEAMLLKIWPHSNMSAGGTGPSATPGGPNPFNSGASTRNKSSRAHSPVLSRGQSRVSCGNFHQRASIDLGVLSSFTARTNPLVLAATDTVCTAAVNAVTDCGLGPLPPSAAGAFPLRLSNTPPGSRSSRRSGSLEPPSPRVGAAGSALALLRLFHPSASGAGSSAGPGAPPSGDGPHVVTSRRPGELSRRLQELHEQQQQQQEQQPHRWQGRQQQHQQSSHHPQDLQVQQNDMHPHAQQHQQHQQQPQPATSQHRLHQQQQQQRQLLRQHSGLEKPPSRKSLLNSSGGWAFIQGGVTAALLEDQSDDADPATAIAAAASKLAAAAVAVRIDVADVLAPSAVVPTASSSRNPTGSGLIDSGPVVNEPELSEAPSGSELLPKIRVRGFRGTLLGYAGGGGGRRSCTRTVHGSRSGMTPATTPHVQTPGNSRSRLVPGSNAAEGPYATGGMSSWEVCTLEESLKAAMRSFEDGILGDRKRRLLWRGLRVRMGLHSGVVSQSEMAHNRASARTVYSGDCAIVVRAVSDSAQGGMILLSEACLDVLRSMGAAGGLHGAASEALLFNIGRYRIRHKDRNLSLYLATSPDLAPRVAVLPPPRNITPVGLTAYGAPIGKAAIAVLNVPDVAALREYNAEVTAQALGLMEGVLMEQLASHRGYLVSRDWEHDGTMTAAFAFPLDAVRWALSCRDLLSSSPSWPAALLAHELCHEGALPNHMLAGGHLSGRGGAPPQTLLPHVRPGSGPLPLHVSGKGPTRTFLELSHAFTASCDNAPSWTATLSAGGGGGANGGGGAAGAGAGVGAVGKGFREDHLCEARDTYASVAGSSQQSYRTQRAARQSADTDGPMPPAHQGSAGLTAVAANGGCSHGGIGAGGGAAGGSGSIPGAMLRTRTGGCRSPTWRGLASGSGSVRQASGNGDGKQGSQALRNVQSQGTLYGTGPGGPAPPVTAPACVASTASSLASGAVGLGTSPPSKPSGHVSGKVAAPSAQLWASAGGYLESMVVAVQSGAVVPHFGTSGGGGGGGSTMTTARFTASPEAVIRGLCPEGTRGAAAAATATAVATREGASPHGMAGCAAAVATARAPSASSGCGSLKPHAGLTVRTGLTWAHSDDIETEDGGDIFSAQLGGMDGFGPFGRPPGTSTSGGFAMFSPSVCATPQQNGETDRKNAVVLRGPRIRVGIDCGAVDWGVSSSHHCLVYSGRPAATAEKLALLAAGGQVLVTFGVMLQAHMMQASLVAQAEPDEFPAAAAAAAAAAAEQAADGGGGSGSGFQSGLAAATGFRGPAVVCSALHTAWSASRLARHGSRRQQVYSCRFTLNWDEALREHDAFAAAHAAAGGSSAGGVLGGSPRAGCLSPFSSPWSWSAAGRLRNKRPTSGAPSVPGDGRRSTSRRSLDAFSLGSTPFVNPLPRAPGMSPHVHTPVGVSASGPCPSAAGAPVLVPADPMAACRSHPLPTLNPGAAAGPSPSRTGLDDRMPDGAVSRVFASGGNLVAAMGGMQPPNQRQHPNHTSVLQGQAAAGASGPAPPLDSPGAVSASAITNMQPQGALSATKQPRGPYATNPASPQSLVACVQRWIHSAAEPKRPAAVVPPGAAGAAALPFGGGSVDAADAAVFSAHLHASHDGNTDESSLSLRPLHCKGTHAKSDRERTLTFGGRLSTSLSFPTTAPGLVAFLEGPLAQVPEVNELPTLLAPPQSTLVLSPEEGTFASGLAGALMPASPGKLSSPTAGGAVSGQSFSSLSTLSFRPVAQADRSGPPYGSTGVASSSGGAAGSGGNSGASGKLQLALQQHCTYARRQQQQLERLHLAALQRSGAHASATPQLTYVNTLGRRHAAERSGAAAGAVAAEAEAEAADVAPPQRSDGFWKASYMSHGSTAADGQDTGSPSRSASPAMWTTGLRGPAVYSMRASGVGVSSPPGIAGAAAGFAAADGGLVTLPRQPPGGCWSGSAFPTGVSPGIIGMQRLAASAQRDPSLGPHPLRHSIDMGVPSVGWWPTEITAAAQQGYGGVFNAGAAAAAAAMAAAEAACGAAGCSGQVADAGGGGGGGTSRRPQPAAAVTGFSPGQGGCCPGCTCTCKAAAAAGAVGTERCGCGRAGARSGSADAGDGSYECQRPSCREGERARMQAQLPSTGALWPGSGVGLAGATTSQRKRRQQQHTGAEAERVDSGGDDDDDGADGLALQNTYVEGGAEDLARPALVAVSRRGGAPADHTACAGRGSVRGPLDGLGNSSASAALPRCNNVAVAAGLDTTDTDFSGTFDCKCRRATVGDASSIRPLGSGAWAGDSGGFAARTARGSQPMSSRAGGGAGANGGATGRPRERIPTVSGAPPPPRDACGGGYTAAAGIGGLPRALSGSRAPSRHSSVYSASPTQRCAAVTVASPFAPAADLDSFDNSAISEDLDDSRATIRPPAGWRPGVHPPPPQISAPQVRSYRIGPVAGAAAAGAAAGRAAGSAVGMGPGGGLARANSSAARSDGTSAYGQIVSASGWVVDSGGVGRVFGPGRAAGFGRISSSACTASVCHNLDELEMWRDESYGEAPFGRCDSGR